MAALQSLLWFAPGLFGGDLLGMGLGGFDADLPAGQLG